MTPYQIMKDRLNHNLYSNTFPFVSQYDQEPNKVRHEWMKEENRLTELFKNDLFRFYEVQSNPKREKLYDMSWEYGHSNGFSELLNVFNDLVDLIKSE